MNKKPLHNRISVLVLVFVLLLCMAASAESHTAKAMQLLRCEGTVEIEDDAGNLRAVEQDSLFGSGEAVRTGEDSRASISLDDDRFLTMDANSRV